MSIQSWGGFPKIEAEKLKFQQEADLKGIVEQQGELIAFGNGRSYGDSALNNQVLDVKPHHYFLDFDENTGVLHVQAGVLLSDIIESFVPRGWFLKVTPGTKFITVGGAIASDVHGKNHHVEGCFSTSIASFRIMLADGEVVECAKDTHPDLFKATCGGQGLTGIILDAKIHLKKINSQYIEQTSIKTNNLKETFEAFEAHQDAAYSVAWIDCLASGDALGRCLLNVGDFSDDGDLDYQSKSGISMPFYLPSFALNHWSVKAFNWLYYHKQTQPKVKQKVGIDSFFYPLDAIEHWNRAYGKQGFVQYQFILPKAQSFEGLQAILSAIAEAGTGSFLAVLKLYGKHNKNYLSFPLEGYSLALDFKVSEQTFKLFEALDKIVLEYGGRFYLAKDARVSQEVFEQGYPEIETFRTFRKEQGMDKQFQSLQSKRVGI